MSMYGRFFIIDLCVLLAALEVSGHLRLTWVKLINLQNIGTSEHPISEADCRDNMISM